MFSVHITLQEFENASITGHFRFVFEENSGRGTSHTIMVLSFPKCSLLEIFSVHAKTLSRRFKFVMLIVEGALLVNVLVYFNLTKDDLTLRFSDAR